MLILTILIGIVILSLVILAHEFGHFLAAKISHVKVEEFGLGFPPRAVKLFKKKETLYSLNWIPFGGFNKILGEEGRSKDPRAYCNQKVGKRIFISSAGIIANVILAWFLFTVWFWLVPMINLPNYVAIIEVEPGSAAEEAGLKSNDLILRIDDLRPTKVEDISAYTKAHQGQEVEILIKHQGKNESKKITLAEDSQAPLGVILAQTGGEKPIFKWYQAPYLALKEIYAVLYLTVDYIIKGVISLFGGPKVAFELAGPVGVVAFISQTVSVGWAFLIRLAAVISLGLGIFNFLPLPAVDGGKLAFLYPEAILGRRIIHHEHENIIHGIGFILLIILSLIIVYMDIARLIS